jgi:G3E family GTPase
MAEENKRVTILTGFLGSGKTTFLNAVLAFRKSTRFAIVENEFGEEGIDSELILRSEDDIVEMNNGCLCCTLNDNLYDILNQFHLRRDEFDELIIESTGIADPAGIALPFYTHPAIIKAFPLKRVICLVDAELLEDQLQDAEEVVKQIAFSDILLINKCDRVSPEYHSKLKDILKKLNPFATIFSGSKDNYPIKEIFETERAVSEEAAFLAADQSLESEMPVSAPHHHHHHHHGDITSLTFRFAEPFDLDALYNRLYVFLQLQASHVYRVKGIIYGSGQDHKYVFQSVGSNLNYSQGNAWGAEERISRIVFIGKNLEAKGYEKMLRQCLQKN